MSGTHSRFFAYVLSVSSSMLNAIGRGSTFMELSGDDLGAYAVPAPPLDEQRRIAAFLDYETARIDELLQEQERGLALSEVLHFALIRERVCRGVDGGATQKPSGLSGVGHIPEHWRATRLKFMLDQLGSGGTPDTSSLEFWAEPGDGVPWVAISDMSDREEVLATAKSLTSDGLASKRLTVWPPGTLLMSMYASLGHTAVLATPAATNQAILALVPRAGVDGTYLRYWLRFLKPTLVREANSNTQDNLNAEKVRNLPALLPPYEEQKAVGAALEEATRNHKAYVATADRLSALLKERRSALITAAVTGQIDVSTWTPPDDWLTPEAA